MNALTKLISMASFVVVAALASCSQERTDPPVTDLPRFFAGTLNGVTIGFGTGSSSNQSFINTVFDSVVQQAPDSFHVYDGTRFSDPTGQNLGVATVGLLQIFDHAPSSEERAARADTGYLRYAFGDSLPAGGAYLQFRDGNGTEYRSSFHFQSDTSFRLESLTPLSGEPGRLLMQASFRAKLFSDAGDSIFLENGSVRGVFLKP